MLSLPSLDQAVPLSSGEFVHHHGTVPYLTITSIYLYVPIILTAELQFIACLGTSGYGYKEQHGCCPSHVCAD